MAVTLSWQQIALRLLLAMLASALIGFDRDEHGKTAGLRTTMLVCLAATLAMLQANALMPVRGKASDSFVVLDLMRLPLGILSGIGFLGAGAILRRDNMVIGLTTAATLWYVTVLGLLFGGGQLALGIAGTVLGLVILWLLKHLEKHIATKRRGSLSITFKNGSAETEANLRVLLKTADLKIAAWQVAYAEAGQLTALSCDLLWTAPNHKSPGSPPILAQLAASPEIAQVTWRS